MMAIYVLDVDVSNKIVYFTQTVYNKKHYRPTA